MATTPTIPFSNVAGNNQTTPKPILTQPTGSGIGQIPGTPQPPGTPTSQTNPYVPPAGSSTSSAQNGFITAGQDAGQNALQKQLNDIYGQGVGGSLFSLLNSMSGTDSTVLQEYIQSLQPQMAKAQANVNAAEGAGGVGANSSVTALADANLQAQEQASIAGESANLTQNQENLTANILTRMEAPAAKEVATNNWDIFGQVMNNVTGDIGNLVGLGGAAGMFGGGGSGASGSVSQAVLSGAQNQDPNSITTSDPSLYNPQQIPLGA